MALEVPDRVEFLEGGGPWRQWSAWTWPSGGTPDQSAFGREAAARIVRRRRSV